MDNPWIEIRNSAGHLLFRYNPQTNEIEMKKGGFVYEIIRLDNIRAKYGFIEHHVEESYGVFIVPEKKHNGKDEP